MSGDIHIARWVRHAFVFVMFSFIVALSSYGVHGAVPQGNLLPDPGFEKGLNESGWPIGWRGILGVQYGRDVRLVEEDGSTQNMVLALEHPIGKSSAALITDSFPAKPGEVYRVRARVRNSGAKRVGVYLVFLDANGKEHQRGATYSSESWVRLDTQPVIAPPDTAFVRAMIWQGNSVQTTGPLDGTVTYIDDVFLIKEVTTIADVSIDAINRVTPQVKPGEHPRLYVTQAEIDAVHQLAQENSEVRALMDQIIEQPARRIVREYETRDIVFPEKPPNDQGEAIRRSADPIHQRFAKDTSTAALGFAFTGDRDMGLTAKRILLTYADRYMDFSHRAVREGRLTSETREEALWLIEMAWAYDLIFNSDLLSQAEKDQIEAMLREAERIVDGHRIQRQDINWQSGHNAAIIAAGVVLEDQEIIEKVLVGPKSFVDLIPLSVRLDGMTFSQSVSHHLFAADRWLLVAEAAYRSGYDIYTYDFGGRTLKDLIDLPFYYVFSHGEHPLVGHARYGTHLSFNWPIAVALKRYGDSKYLWLWRRGGLQALANQDESRRTLFYLPSLMNMSSPDEPKHAISFGPIGSKGRNTSGSTLLEDSGFAILRGASPDGTQMEAVMLFKPHGTVNGHQGSDNLTLMVSGKDSVWIPGTGSPGYAYDRPEQRGWYEQTVARSGVVVDESPQYPLSDNDTRYAMDSGRSSAGKLINFIALPSASYARATTDTVYAGVTMKRTLLMSAPYMIDRYDVDSADEHLYDWVVHVKGQEHSIDVAQTPRSGSLGDKPGYQYMNQVRTGQSDETWTATWTKPNEAMRVIMLGGEETVVVRAEGIGESVNVRQPLIMARRQARDTQYVALYELYKDASTISGLSRIDTDEFSAVIVDREDGKQDRWVWTAKNIVPEQSIEVARGLAFTGQEAFFRPADWSNVQTALVIDGTFLEFERLKVRSEVATDLAVETVGRDLIVVSQAGDREVGLAVTVPCNRDNPYRLFRLESDAADGGRVIALELNGLTQQATGNCVLLQWTAQPNDVYVISPTEPEQDWLDRYAIEVTF